LLPKCIRSQAAKQNKEYAKTLHNDTFIIPNSSDYMLSQPGSQNHHMFNEEINPSQRFQTKKTSNNTMPLIHDGYDDAQAYSLHF
jgi:hypothetical protein